MGFRLFVNYPAGVWIFSHCEESQGHILHASRLTAKTISQGIPQHRGQLKKAIEVARRILTHGRIIGISMRPSDPPAWHGELGYNRL